MTECLTDIWTGLTDEPSETAFSTSRNLRKVVTNRQLRIAEPTQISTTPISSTGRWRSVAPVAELVDFIFQAESGYVFVQSKGRDIGRTSLARTEQTAFEARVRELERLTSEANWDLERGLAVPSILWCEARSFYASAREVISSWVEPFVSPSGDGTVHLTWTRDGGRLNLEICEGRWHLAVKPTSGANYRSADVSSIEALTQLRDFLG